MIAMYDDDAPAALTEDDAFEALDGLPLVPVMAGTMDDMKRLRDRCLAAGVPVLVGCPGGGRGSS